MLNYQDYLTESKEGKNLHLEHLEDEVLNGGVSGTRGAISFLQSLRDMLAGHATGKSVNLTTKWDGAPAIFAGINPENGKFFVGTKGVFAQNAKLNYTPADIDANYPGSGVNSINFKLKVALRYFPELGISGVLQGDMMFISENLKIETIDGKKHIAFQPNTIVYVVPEDTKLAETIKAAKIGVVWHTTYSGENMADMKASFGAEIGGLKQSKNVWFRDASFVDASGTATFTEQETKQITNILSDIGNLFRGINPVVLNRIATTETIRTQIKTFNNSKVRAGQVIGDTFKHVRELTRSIEDKLNKEILSAKLDKTKQKRIAEKSELMRFYRNNATELKKIFDIQNGLVEAKSMIVKKLQQIQQVTGTFLRTDTGFKITNAEGFVAVDHIKGNAVKLVDRLEFSQANFNAAKAWSK